MVATFLANDAAYQHCGRKSHAAFPHEDQLPEAPSCDVILWTMLIVVSGISVLHFAVLGVRLVRGASRTVIGTRVACGS